MDYYTYSHLPLLEREKVKDYHIRYYVNGYNDIRNLLKLPKLTLEEYKKKINYVHYDMNEKNYGKILKQLRPIDDERELKIYNEYQKTK